MKSGNLNFLEHSGPLQDCNGTDLPFTLMVIGTLNYKVREQQPRYGSNMLIAVSKQVFLTLVIDL